MSDEPLLELRVYGQPAVAGSKAAHAVFRTGPDGQRQFTGKVTVHEVDKRHKKRDWRSTIVDAAHAVIVADPETGRFHDPYPLNEALIMQVVVTVRKPASAPKNRRSWPVARPDLLKYIRAIEDALQAAGVYVDDARIVRYRDPAKVYPREDPDALDTPGALIRIWRVEDLTDWQRAAVSQPGSVAETLFD